MALKRHGQARKNFNERAFPEIAQAALRSRSLHELFFLHRGRARGCSGRRPGDCCPQDDIVSFVRKPPLTVFAGRRFYIAINFWPNATVSIHEHGFTGVFQVMAGLKLPRAPYFSGGAGDQYPAADCWDRDVRPN